MSMSTKARTKLIVLAIIILLSVIVVLQNAQVVETRILFFPAIRLPNAVLLFVTLSVGFAAGILFSNYVRAKR